MEFLKKKITKVDTDLEKSRGRVVSLSNEVNKNKTTTEERFTKTDSEITQLKVDVSKIREQLEYPARSEINNLKTDINKINESLQHHPDKWNDIVKNQVTESLNEVNGNISEVQNSIKETQEQAAEHPDKEHRRNKVILYKYVNESDLQRADDIEKKLTFHFAYSC